jgi:hypothetical protein
MMEDRATRGLQRMTQQTEKATKASGLLRGGLGRLAAVGVGAFGIHKAGKALIGFNSDMEQARTTMAGMIQLNLGGEWSANMATATGLVDKFQERAKKSVGTTKDFVGMAQMLARPVTAAGLGMKELEDITAGATVAARAFGMQAELAALDIEQALMGTLGKKDRFARALIGPILKQHGATLKSFNALDAKSRAVMLKQALTSKTIQDMSEAQAGTFAGVYSTFEDNMQRFLGAVGMPLFKAITAELQKWNGWLENNQDKVNRWASSFGKALVGGFRFIGKTIAFFVKHKDTLLFIAKAWAAMKIGQKLGGLVTAAGAIMGRGTRRAGGLAMMGGMDRAGLKLGKFGAGISKVTSVVGRWVPALGVAAIAVSHFAKMLNLGGSVVGESARKAAADAQARAQKEHLLPEEVRQKLGTYKKAQKEWVDTQARAFETQQLNKARADLEGHAGSVGKYYQGLAERAVKAGLINRDLTAMKGPTEIRKWAERTESHPAAAMVAKNAMKDLYSALGDAAQSPEHARLFQSEIKRMLAGQFQEVMGRYGRVPLEGAGGTPATNAALDKALSELGKGGKAKVSVTINKIEVQTDDPDRWVFEMSEAFSDAAKNPSSVIDTFREK